MLKHILLFFTINVSLVYGNDVSNSRFYTQRETQKLIDGQQRNETSIQSNSSQTLLNNDSVNESLKNSTYGPNIIHLNQINQTKENNASKKKEKDIDLYIKDDDDEEELQPQFQKQQQGINLKGGHHQMSPWMLKQQQNQNNKDPYKYKKEGGAANNKNIRKAEYLEDPWDIGYYHLSEREIKYGYDGEGWKSGSYYTKYIPQNPKFYTKDKYYHKEIYTPFWNTMRSSYQAYDCGIDCDYLGPRNLMMTMVIYVTLVALFIGVGLVVLCSKEKLDMERPVGNPLQIPIRLDVNN